MSDDLEPGAADLAQLAFRLTISQEHRATLLRMSRAWRRAERALDELVQNAAEDERLSAAAQADGTVVTLPRRP